MPVSNGRSGTPASQPSGEAYESLFRPAPTAAAEARARQRDPTAPRGSLANPHMPRTRAEARALPSGHHFVDPTGAVRVRH
jgi:hypothetical protein